MLIPCEQFPRAMRRYRASERTAVASAAVTSFDHAKMTEAIVAAEVKP